MSKKKNELFIQGFCYFPTNATSQAEAVREYAEACSKVGINCDNMNTAELRDADGNPIGPRRIDLEKCKQIYKLCEEIAYEAPDETECSDAENEFYAECANIVNCFPDFLAEFG